MSRMKVETTNEEINKVLDSYNTYFENGEIHMKCWCDSTLAFLVEMQQLLKLLGCEDIKHECGVDEKAKPPYNYLFHAWGKNTIGKITPF